MGEKLGFDMVEEIHLKTDGGRVKVGKEDRK